MANRTDAAALSVHGTNPQFLLGKIVRSKVYESTYWKEQCFGLNAGTIVKKAAALTHIGGTYGGTREATPFLCLVVKLLQIQPKREVVLEYLKDEDFKYLRALAAFYYFPGHNQIQQFRLCFSRLVGDGLDVYRVLEPLLLDYRKLRYRKADGSVEIIRMDEFIDSCLKDAVVLEVDLPVLPLRHVLEETGRLPPRVSVLDFNEEDPA